MIEHRHVKAEMSSQSQQASELKFVHFSTITLLGGIIPCY